MYNNIRTLAICGGIAVSAAFLGTAQAQITFSSTPGLGSWNGSPQYVSLANSALGSATTAQGDPTITGAFGLLAETFTPSSSFTLGSFNILLAVNSISEQSYDINLLDLGAAGSISVSSSSATYGPFAERNVLNGPVTFSATTRGEVQGTFTLPLADQVTLSAGEEYALEILTSSGSGQNGLTWYRSLTADPGGQMFSSGNAEIRNTLAGNGQAGGAPRTGSLALYAVVPVPEPTTLALAGLGSLVSLLMFRRK